MNNKANKSDIPDTSEFATKEDLAGKADTTAVPTKTSQLTNDSGFITGIPSEYVTETELTNKGYLTEHQDISGKADKSDIPDVSGFATKDDVDAKQDKLTAGDGITIEGNVISASGGGGDYLPLTGGTLTGELVVPETNGLRFGTRTIFTQNGAVLYIYPSGSTSLGGLGFTRNEIFSTYTSEYTKLGRSSSPWGTVYVMKLNNGADITIPTTGGTMALKEDIDAAVGDISTALTAILGE